MNKHKQIITLLLILIAQFNCYSQTTVNDRITVLNPNHNYILTNNLWNKAIPSPMTYDPAQVSTKGAAFEIEYHNSDGGDNYDGYPCGTVGAYKKGKTYYPGVFSACGMPVQIKDIDNDFRIKWDPYQQNVSGPNDQWWASINVIFDGGNKNAEPIDSDRDYDLVIQFESYEQVTFDDKAKRTGAGQGGQYYFFCRDGFVDNGHGVNIAPLHTFDLVVDGITYKFAVRYKFFNYPQGSPQNKLDKNNKVHIKFIPVDNSNVMPYLDHPLKSFIDATKTFYNRYIDNLPAQEKALADQKVGKNTLWVKSISAGYEVYKDAGNNNGNDPNHGIILGQHFLMTIKDNNPPAVVNNVTISASQPNIKLVWNPSTDSESVNSEILEYRVYRSEDGANFTLLSDKIYEENYTDTTAQNGTDYFYYITAVDRSFNESAQSNIVSTNTLNVNNESLKELNIYPNPFTNSITINKNVSKEDLSIYNVLGQNVTKYIHVINNNKNTEIITKNLPKGVYILKTKTFNKILVK